MCIEIVEHHNYLFSLWIKLIRHNPHHLSPFQASSLIPDFDVAFSSQWFEEHEKVCRATSFVSIIGSFGWSSNMGSGSWMFI
jgi:hypothetical protein